MGEFFGGGPKFHGEVWDLVDFCWFGLLKWTFWEGKWLVTLPPKIIVQWKIGVSPRLVSILT